MTYEANVSSTGRGRLAAVAECAGNTSNCFEPTTFSYWDGDNDLDGEQSSGSTISGTNALSVDINGDGHTDLVYASGGTWWYRCSCIRRNKHIPATSISWPFVWQSRLVAGLQC